MFGIGLIKIIFNPHWVIKVFWVFVLLGSLGMSIYLILKLFQDFFKYNVVTTRKQIFETPTQFPEVTICNQNPVTTKSGYIAGLDANFPLDLGTLSVSQQQSLSHTFEDILFACTFNNIECTTNDFFWYFDRNLGNCWAFNSGNNSSGQTVNLLNSIRAGADYGLQMTLYSNYYENLTYNNSFNGMIVKVVNASFLDLSDGIYLAPGFVTNVAIDRFFELLLPKPYSDCDIPNDSMQTGYSTFYDAIFYSPYQYSQELCLNLCYQQDIIDVCGCNPYDYPFFGGIACQDSDQSCIKNATTKFLKGNYLIRKCLPLCPLECNRTGYSVSLSQSLLNGDFYLRQIQSNSNLTVDYVTKLLNSDTAAKSLVSVNLFYESLSYTLSEEDPACDWICMIANIGGTMGLFMGAGLLSLGEVIEVLMELFFLFKEVSQISQKF